MTNKRGSVKPAAKQHGVIVTTRGRHNTKTVWNRGHRMITYKFQPRRLRFRSRMVNDRNQHLCGGWRWPGLEDDDKWVERQLVAGRKAFGIMHHSSKALADECAGRLRGAGLFARVGRGFVPGNWIVEACHDIRVRDIGDMDALLADYVDAMPVFAEEFRAEFRKYADRRLRSFAGKRWDVEFNPLWVTGLVLGYPVENTISIYHEAVS